MKKILLYLLLCMTTMVGYAGVNQITSKGSNIVISAKDAMKDNHYTLPIDCPIVVFYIAASNCITVDFGTQPVNNYTVTISSLYADVDYYATSSFTTIPLAVDGISDYSIVIETAEGDVFEGTLYASQYVTSQTQFTSHSL